MRKTLVLIGMLFSLVGAALAQEDIVTITSDDIILNEPLFSDYIKQKMPFYVDKMINLEKEQKTKRLNVDFQSFRKFWKAVRDYYFLTDVFKNNIDDWEEESVEIREQIFQQSSLKSSSAIKLILSYKFLKKNIEHTRRNLKTLDEDLRLLLSLLKTVDIRPGIKKVRNLRSYTGFLVDTFAALKAEKIEFKDFETKSRTHMENFENGPHLQKQFLKIAIEVTGAFHVKSEMEKTLAVAIELLKKVYYFELYVISNQKITIATLTETFIALLTIVIVYFVLKLVFFRLISDTGMSYAVKTLTKYVVIAIFFVTFLAGIGVDLMKITMLATALSVGMGFGLTTIVSNLISGILLLIERTVRVGDKLMLPGGMVTVEVVGLRKSVLKTLDGVDIVVPNTDLVTKEVINLTYMKNPVTRNKIAFNVNPAVDLKLLEKVALKSVIKSLGGKDKMVGGEPRLLVSGISTGQIDCELWVFIDNVNNFIPDAVIKKNLLNDFLKNDLDIFLAPVTLLEIIKNK
ncbi:MAG: mechanosensitive ion channel [Proteobacteria bacterium]|nr:mechanosensitive ion channel [Pseudomonadota bacterium]